MIKNATITLTLNSETELKVQCTNSYLTKTDFVYFLSVLKRSIQRGDFEISGNCEYIEETLNLQ